MEIETAVYLYVYGTADFSTSHIFANPPSAIFAFTFYVLKSHLLRIIFQLQKNPTSYVLCLNVLVL